MSSREIEPFLKEIKIGNVTVRNRFVRSATHEWLAANDGMPTARIGQIYKELAKNNVGLIISGHSFVSQCGRGSSRQQGIYDDQFIEEYARITREVHKFNSRFFVQISHAGRQALVTNDCKEPLAPSTVRLPESARIPGKIEYPKQMDDRDIRNVINDFVRAISRLRRARVDGVQLHCAHGFLLSSFLSPYTNIREDDWGGDTHGRTRIVIEILRMARKEDDSFPIAVKMNSWDGVKGGIDGQEAVEIAKILNSESIAAIEVSGGTEDARREITCMPDILVEENEAYFKEFSKAIKRKVDCPVILVGGLRSLGVMRKMIVDQFADMVSISRPLIREPDLITKFINGDSKRATCISCNNCFDETGIKCNYFE